MSRRHSYSEVIQASETRRSNNKKLLRQKIFYRWGILVFVGIFSFLYWFVLIPLVAPILPATWVLIGPVAFVIWLIIIFPFLWLWYYKQKALVALPPRVEEDVECPPPYPITVSTVQQSFEANSASVAQESCVWVPVQPGNATPSLYNSQTGRDSFQSGYQLDEMPEKSVAQEGISRNNSAVQLSKKTFNEAKQGNSNRLISVSSSSSTEIDGLDFKLTLRDRSDSLNSGKQTTQGKKVEVSGEGLVEEEKKKTEKDEDEDGEKEEPKEVENEKHFLQNELSSVASNQAVELADKTPLEREQSFKGLPEMQNFGEYLRLVTVDTPLSPRDAFFSDLGQTEPPNTVVTRNQHQRSYHPGGDLSEIQRRIAEARKSLPPLFHYPDLEMGETRSLKTTTLPQHAVYRLENEQNEQNEKSLPQRNCWSVSEGRKHSWDATQKVSRPSGEFFVADASRLNSVTSEMQIVVDSTKSACHLSRWETVVQSDGPSVGNSSVQTDPEEPFEGRFVILSRDYASNNLEAFIRCEQEAMCRERSEGIFINEDLEDSVFLEVEN